MSATSESSQDHLYFRAIEETFIRLRGAPLLLSPDDWQMAKSWRQQGIPLALVLATLEEVFEARQQKGARGRIQGLRYCRPAVEAAWERQVELTATGSRGAVGAIDVDARLRLLHDLLSAHPDVPTATVDRVLELTGDAPEVEEALMELDRRMLGQLEGRLPPEVLERIDSASDTSLRTIGNRLDDRERERVRARLRREAIRRHFQLPVLSLFAATAGDD